MTIVRIARLAGLVAIAVAMAVLPARALAAEPTFTPVQGVFTFTDTSTCGFPIMGKVVINQKMITYADGTTKSVESGRNYFSYSTAYGTLIGPIAGIGEIIPNPNGTYTIIGTGPSNFVTVPGSGPVMGSAGHFVGLFDSDFNLISATQVGVTGNNLAAFCTYLGPPGYQYSG